MASASTSSAQHKDDAESDSLQNVLQQIGMDEFIPAFRDNLISLNQVNELSQSDFEKLGVVAIGNRIKIKSAVAAFLKGSESISPVVSKFIELQQQRRRNKPAVVTMKNSHSVKSTRRVRVGWKHEVTKNKYKIITIKEGGGQQIVDLDKDSLLSDATEQIVNIFFPNGHSLQYQLSQLNYYLATFTDEKIENATKTVGQYFEGVKSHPVRWYLHTKLKADNSMTSDDELPDLNLFPVKTATSKISAEKCVNNVDQTQTVHSGIVSTGSDETESSENSEDFGEATCSKAQTNPIVAKEEEILETGTPTVTFKRRKPKFLRRSRRDMKSETNIYSSYVGLMSGIITISSSEEEDNMDCEHNMFSSPAITIDGSKKEAKKLYDILQDLKFGGCETFSRSTKVNVTRSDPLDGARRALHRKDFNANNQVSVKFADDYGTSEGAVDSGGPRRELFRLLLLKIKDSKLLVGEDYKKIFTIDHEALRDGLYKDFGVLLGMAIVHGDQWPAFFHPEFYMSMATGTNLFTIDAITDIEQKHVIMKLQQAETNEEINQVIEENYTIFTISGCYSFGKFLVAQKHQIIKNLLYFLAYSRSLPAIQQFLEGLEACGVKDAVYEYPEQLKEVFCFTKRPLTATMVEAVFSKVEFSEVGSNKRLGEERTITHWTDFLMDIEDGNSVVSLRELLSFTTGSDQIPFLGFGIDPSIEFLQEGSYPQANTCGMVLRLPIHEKYDFFKESMEFGILNSPGFGMA